MGWRAASRRWALLVGIFAVAAGLLFIRQLSPERVLLPVDALFLFPPYREAAAQLGVIYPENPLVSDTILQNVGWKQLAAQQWQAGQPPLWNPHILTGQPFLAAGQNASLYPLGILFYVLPLAEAYEWFAVLHFTLAGVFTAMFVRALRGGWLAGLVGGLAFALCGFLVVSVVWPMMVSTAIWLPLLLCCIERFIAGPGTWQGRARWLTLGIVVIALQFLAGHLEISFYILATAGAYTTLRLSSVVLGAGAGRQRLVGGLGRGSALLGMVGAGALIAAVQIIPFIEAIGQNVRVGQVTFHEVQGFAFDRGQWWSFILPDFFGNPTHRTLLDAASGEPRSVEHVRPATGEFRRDTEWGRRNYVEGASYLGVTTLVLATLGALTRWRTGWPLVVIALGALLFAFGTPLYGLVFYGLPGGNQVHTPFRWVYPWSLMVAALAGLGAQALRDGLVSRWQRRSALMLGSLALASALGALAAGLWIWLTIRSDPGALDAIWRRWPEYRDGFSSGGAFGSALAPQLLGLGLLLALTGGLVIIGTRRPSRVAVVLLAGLIAGDLWTFGVGFNPAGEKTLLEYQPPALQVLAQQPGPARIAVLGPADVLPANLAMKAGLEDIRGYDTIIGRDYVDYLNLIERPGALLYSKVEKLFDERSLTAPLFHALNVGYVLSEQPINLPGYELISDAGVHVYRNEAVLPRASILGDARVVAGRDEALAELRRIDPRHAVVLEGSVSPRSGGEGQVERVDYGPNQATVQVRSEQGGILVLRDAYAPGWIALVDGAERPVLRANRAFRAVELPPGAREVRFLYRPMSFRVGLLLSAVGGLILGTLALGCLWPRKRAEAAELTPLGRLARNISAPFGANLVSRLLDLGLALVMFRLLGPVGVGAYTFAVVLTGYLDILAGFGLSTLVTRDAARHPERVALYLGNSLLLRGLGWSAAALVALIVIGPLGGPLEVGPDLALAIGLLVLGLLPSSISATLSSLLHARERFDIPAGVTLVTAVLKVILGLGVLLAGTGFVGLALVSIVTNLITAMVLGAATARAIGLPRPRLDGDLARAMLWAAYPLMLSQVLNALFFRIDALLLKPLAGEEALGWYSTAYRFIDAFQIIPSTVILALFPMLSRQADDQAATTRTSTHALRALLMLAFPIAMGSTVLAEPIILAFAGAPYVPQSVVALQILIWYLPLSFTNGLVQYVLIARGQQKALTLAFGLGVAFNLSANVVLIPSFGYLAAAWITVASELILLVPFLIWLRRDGIMPDILQVAWRPLLASLAMGLGLALLSPLSLVASLVVGPIIYAAVLLATGGVTIRELRALRSG